MLKRFTCMILSLVLLVGMIPAVAVQASAASHATSDGAITILKKLEGFDDHCEIRNGAYGHVAYTGYGTKCTETAPHGYTQPADVISNYNHPANMATWYDLKTENGKCMLSPKFSLGDLPILSKSMSLDTLNSSNPGLKTFLNANPALWDQIWDTYSTNGLKRTSSWARGTYKECPIAVTTSTPSKVYYHTIRENEADVALKAEVKKIDTAINNFASNRGVSLSQQQHDALVLFSFENGTGWTQGTDDLQNAVVNGITGNDFWLVMKNWKTTDDNDRRKVEANMYVNGVYSTSTSGVKFAITGTSSADDEDLVNSERAKVTVTNAYINVREQPNIFSTKVGTVYQGEVLRVILDSVQDNTGYLWGLFVDEDYDKVGYVALMYTNYDQVMANDKYQTEMEDSAAPKIVGSAKVKVAGGYVNVRSGAGTKNPIVSSLRDGTEVDLYAVQYVNGQRWAKTTVGWFSLAYAENIKIGSGADSSKNDYGYQNFKFIANGTQGAFEDGKRVYGYQLGTTPINIKEATFTTITEVTVRQNPGISETRVDTLAKGTEFGVTQVISDKNTIWGLTDDGKGKYEGWVDLSTQYVTRNGAEVKDEEAEDAAEECTLATAKVDVNVRNMADIHGTKVGTLPAGTTVEVLDGPINGTRRTGWYQLRFANGSGTESWARGDNLDIFDGTKGDITYGKTQTSPDGSHAATGQGMVANTYGGVNVRTAPGTANAKVTKLLPGTVVDILEVTMYGSTKWGRIEQGWVCMDYIAMTGYDELPDTSTTITSTKAIYEGKVANADTKVYKEADRTSEVVRTLDAGDEVTVHELLTVSEVTFDDGTTTHTTKAHWTRVNDGYILNPQTSIILDTLYEQVYTVTGTDMLKVRVDAGTSSAREDLDLNKGDQVKITKLKIVEDQIWGMFEDDALKGDNEGWICLSYCTAGAVSVGSNEDTDNGGSDNSGAVTAPVTMSIGNTGKGNYSGKIIGSAQVQEVNVRKEPSSNAEKVTDLKKGTAVTITETKLVDGRSWGYCGSGWINLLYVDLTPVGITAIDAKVIAVDNTLCYESSDTGARVVGSYANRAVVNIYEEMNGMYKTDMGWISKGNCL